MTISNTELLCAMEEKCVNEDHKDVQQKSTHSKFLLQRGNFYSPPKENHRHRNDER